MNQAHHAIANNMKMIIDQFGDKLTPGQMGTLVFVALNILFDQKNWDDIVAMMKS